MTGTDFILIVLSILLAPFVRNELNRRHQAKRIESLSRHPAVLSRLHIMESDPGRLLSVFDQEEFNTN